MKYDQLLSTIEDTFSRSNDVKDLLIDTYNIISESGNYSLCWIGLINEYSGRMELLSECISEKKYLNAINSKLNQSINKNPTSDNRFILGNYYVNNDIWNDPDFKEDRKIIPTEFNSLAIFPIIQNLKKIGSVYLYSEKKGFFKQDELMLLEILSMNLSLALDKISDETTLPPDKKKDLEKQNEKLLYNRKRTEELNRLRANFLTIMGHKLRTPLNSIIGFAELLAKKDIPEKERGDYSQLIVNQSNDLLQNINNILQISKMGEKTIILYKETVSLNNLLDDLYKIYLTKLDTLNKKHINLICKKPQIKGQIEITTDVSKFRQIFTSLLDNSVKFTDSGEISFGYLSKTETDISYFVADTGIGIQKKDQKYLFDIFEQSDEVKKRNYGDPGLGLAICKSDAQLLGGDIWVQSEPGKGATFYFTIKSTSKEIKPSSVLTKNKTFHWNTHEILIVEDDYYTIQYLTKILEQGGYKISVAHDKGEAEKIFQKLSQIDLVLLDMSLPDVSGFDLAKQIKKIRHDIPVIAQTALSIEDNGKQFLEAGCDGYISKPYRREQIMNLINSYMA
jgi:signal transduction histidine kinase